MRTSYPRTPHLPWSPGASPDDMRAVDLGQLLGRQVVVTEKLDGENTTLYPDGLHARSLDSAHHPSRTWVKSLHGRVARLIPAGWRLCGENMFARHSIAYDDLDSWFYLFSVWAGDRCLDWDETVRFSRTVGIPTPPVLWRGTFDERTLRALRLDLVRQEGYVVRTVAGFDQSAFAGRVAKWVRRGHVVTDTHWMLAPVVPNRRGSAAAFWDVRSGAAPDVPGLVAALDLRPPRLAPDPLTSTDSVAQPVEEVVGEVAARLDQLGRSGEARLAGVLAAMSSTAPRSWLTPRLVGRVGVPLARRVGDLVGLHTLPQRPFPDEDRRSGLRRLALAVDVGVLHALAAGVLGRDDDGEVKLARDQVDWSSLYAEEAGLLQVEPLRPLRTGLRELVDDRPAADRCWAEAREAFASGRITTVAEASALTWRWRDGDFPRLIVMTGPSGSGKSQFVAGLADIDEIVSMDDLRQARGARGRQRDNPEILREALDRLDRALSGRRTVVWDATAINRAQRSLVDRIARRRDAWTTHAVLLVDEDEIVRRNAGRAHQVPPEVLAAQLRRHSLPYPGEAARTWYVGPGGRVDDVAGAIDSEDP